MADLWSYNREELVGKVKALMTQRGQRIRGIMGLTTGLWVGVMFEDGSIINVYDYELEGV